MLRTALNLDVIQIYNMQDLAWLRSTFLRRLNCDLHSGTVIKVVVEESSYTHDILMHLIFDLTNNTTILTRASLYTLTRNQSATILDEGC